MTLSLILSAVLQVTPAPNTIDEAAFCAWVLFHVEETEGSQGNQLRPSIDAWSRALTERASRDAVPQSQISAIIAAERARLDALISGGAEGLAATRNYCLSTAP
jgi:hypothetical protein